MQTCKPLPTLYIPPPDACRRGMGAGGEWEWDSQTKLAARHAPRDGKGARQCNSPSVSKSLREQNGLHVPTTLLPRPRIFPESVTFRGPVPLSAGVGPEVAGRAMQRVSGVLMVSGPGPAGETGLRGAWRAGAVRRCDGWGGVWRLWLSDRTGGVGRALVCAGGFKRAVMVLRSLR